MSKIVKHNVLAKTKVYRFFEILVPFTALLILFFPVYLSPWYPNIAAYLILLFFCYVLYKAIKIVFYSILAFRILEIAQKTDWKKMLSGLADSRKDQIEHFFLITNYKEDVEKICTSIDALVANDFPIAQKTLVLAFEEREGEQAKERSAIITKKYKDKFADILSYYHPVVTGEIVGKASNEAFAAKSLAKYIHSHGKNPKNCLIDVLDADSIFPSNYCNYLTYKYLTTKESEYKFFWAPVLLYNNFWKLILPVRVQSIASNVIRLSILPQGEDLIQISSYSCSLFLLQEIDYWDTDIIPEDWHLYLQTYFRFPDKVMTIPLYTPISGDPVHTNSMLSTLANRYEQEKRWAWGVTDIPYALTRLLTEPLFCTRRKLRKIFYLIEIHLFWPTGFFLSTFGALVPGWINDNFARSTLGFLLPKMSSFILTISSLLLVVFIYFDYRLRAKLRIPTRIVHVPLLFIQWYFLPFISLLFSSLPALEAHMRLLIGKKIEYKVTEKA